MLCRQPLGSANISWLYWAKGNLLKIIRPLPPAAVSCRTQPLAPNSVAHAGAGHSAGPGLLDKPWAAEDPGSGFLVPVRFLLGERDCWCCALPMPRVVAGWAHHQQAGPTAAAQHRTPVWLPSHLPFLGSLANSRGIRDTDHANSSSPGKREDRDWHGVCAPV